VPIELFEIKGWVLINGWRSVINQANRATVSGFLPDGKVQLVRTPWYSRYGAIIDNCRYIRVDLIYNGEGD